MVSLSKLSQNLLFASQVWCQKLIKNSSEHQKKKQLWEDVGDSVKEIISALEASDQAAFEEEEKIILANLRALGYVIGRSEASEKKSKINISDLNQFSTIVQEVVNTLPGMFQSKKVLIYPVWEMLNTQGLKLGLDNFKKLLLQAHQQGLLELARLDLTRGLSAQNEQELSASELFHLEAVYNTIMKTI